MLCKPPLNNRKIYRIILVSSVSLDIKIGGVDFKKEGV